MESYKKIKLLACFCLLLGGSVFSQNEATKITPITVDVTENGAATCQIPITVSPGTNNMQPNINIVYNSHSRMGNVGWGWHISGISSIVRGSKNQHFDNIIEGIQSNYDDAFYLDGNRMLKILPISSFNWNGIEFGLENEDFLRIIAKVDTSTSKKYFEATGVDGNIMIYEPQINNWAGNENHPIEWYLSKVTDPNGNYMRFQYGTVDNEVLLQSIAYSGNESAGITPSNNVTFIYAPIGNGANMTYSAGISKKQTNVLQQIIINCENKVIRTYNFDYDMSLNFYPFLSKVTEYGKSGTTLYPVEITLYPAYNFGHKKEDLGEIYRNDNTKESQTLIGGDFNGDKMGDYATLRWERGSVDIIPHLSCSSKVTAYRQVNGFPLYNIYKSHTVADIDNDNSDEIILAIGQINMNNIAYLYLKWNQCDSIFDTITILKGEYKYFEFGRVYKVANFDQNINLDFITVKRNGDTPYESIVYIRRNFCEYPDITTAETVGKFNGYCEIDAIDYDGDGISELLVITEQNTLVYKYKYGQFVHIATIGDIKTSFINGLKNLHFGDFNGDGITDRLTGTNRSYSINLGTGKGFSSEAYTKMEAETIPAPTYNDDVYLMDVNNDGKTDIIFKYYSKYTTATDYYLYTFLTIGFSGGKHIVKVLNGGSGISSNKIPVQYPVCFADFDANGTIDYLYWANKFEEIHVYRAIFKDNNCLKVKEIKESSGVKHTFEYKPIEFNTAFGLHKNHLKYVLNTVEHYIVKTPSNDTTVNMHYKFENSYYDNDKQAFLGFQKVIKTDAITGMQDNIYYAILRTSHQLYLEKTERFCNNSIIMSSINTFRELLLNNTNNRYLVFKEKTILTDYIKGVYQYLGVELYGSEHINGNIIIQGRLKSTTSYLHFKESPISPSSIFEYKEYKKYNYGSVTLPNGKTIVKVVKDSTAWNPALKSSTSSPVMKKTVAYHYSSGNLDRVVTTEEGKTITVQYSNYNAFGHAQTISTIGENETRNEFLQYDSKGRFVTEKRNDYNFTESWIYDNSTGQPTKYTDINNNITSYRYDNLGRLVSTRYPDGTHDSIVYGFSTSLRFTLPYVYLAPNAKYYQSNLRNGICREISVFDALGREVLHYNNDHYIHTKYNRKGLVDSISEPFLSIANNILWNTYQYDALNRLIAEKGLYKDVTISYLERYANYANGEIIHDRLRGTSKTKYYNLDGSLARINDVVGVTEYKAATKTKGNITIKETTITLNSTDAIVIEEDASDNRLLLSDPNAGTITSVYNEFNELKSQTDANGVTSSYSYDLLGRVTQCVMSGAGHNTTMTYSYDGNNKKGTLSLETISPENNAITYLYDNLLRLTQKTYTNNGQEFSYRYTYNNKGLLDTMVYPYDFSIKHSYDKYDRLKRISRVDDPLFLYEVRNFSLRGGPDFYMLGPYLGTRIHHNNAGLLAAKITGKGYLTNPPINPGRMEPSFQNVSTLGENVPIMSLSFVDETIEDNDPFIFVLRDSSIQYHSCTYNNKGNLIYRHYNYYPPYPNYQGEWFSYDNLDRLESGSGVLPSSNNYYTDFYFIDRYHKHGYNKNKMTSKFKTGTYSYDPSKPHAITNVEVDDASALSSLNRCDLTYNAFNKVKTIAEGDYHYEVKYYPDQQRAMTTLKQNNTILERKQYVEKTFEIENVSGRRYYYVYAYGQPVAVFIGQEDNLTPYFIHTDHLGSINVITDKDGNKVEKMSFNAWGERRNPDDWSLRADRNTSYLIDRGFTMHQHLDVFNLINMNGRIYDPMLGHFLSPDPYIQVPDNPLNFNRYAYALFNPLKYTDPTGYLFDWYQHGNEMPIWQPSSESTLTIDGKKYRNIGESVSIQQVDGTYLNYYQNIPFRSDQAFNALDYILANNLQSQLIGTYSKLWEQGKIDLMQASVYKAQNDFMNSDPVQIFTAIMPVGGAIKGIASLGTKVIAQYSVKMGAKTFFESAKYSNKVLRQMNNINDIYHAFPNSVDAFATKYGKWSTKIGSDGEVYQWLKLNGSYGGKTGTFEFIKDANGIINHRYFNVP